MRIPRVRWNINEDAEAELRYWVNQLIAALGLGAVFGLASGILIAFLPQGEGRPGSEFAREFWPYVVECAFWLGMFLGMMWGAGKRLGSALAGILPWQAPKKSAQATGRLFGQWASFAALVGFSLWFTFQVALAAGMSDMALFVQGFRPLASACWLSAGLFAAIAVASRWRPRAQRGLPRPPGR